MLDYNFKLWKIMVSSFAPCGVILHFLSSWGWEWKIPEHSAQPLSFQGLHRSTVHTHRSSGRAIGSATLRALSRTGEVGSSWARSSWWGTDSSGHSLAWGISFPHGEVRWLDQLGRGHTVPPGNGVFHCLWLDTLSSTLDDKKKQRYGQPQNNVAQSSWPPEHWPYHLLEPKTAHALIFLSLYTYVCLRMHGLSFLPFSASFFFFF